MPRPGPRPYECVRRAWHSDRHQPIRGSLIQEIFRIVNEIHSSATKKNKEWQEKLPIVVLKSEEIMYSKANSEAEYVDVGTLWSRVNDAINTIIRRDESTETGELLQPCIEAALQLGCPARRASRSQRNNNTPRFYLNNPEKNKTFSIPPQSLLLLPPTSSNSQQLKFPISPNSFTPNVIQQQQHIKPCSSIRFSSSSPYSVYPLYYGNQFQSADYKFRTTSSSCEANNRKSELKKLTFCEANDAKDVIFETPPGNGCDLSLRLVPLVVPCLSAENNWPQEVEDGGFVSTSKVGTKKIDLSSKNDKEFSFFPPTANSTHHMFHFSPMVQNLSSEEGLRKRKMAAVSHHPSSEEDRQLSWPLKFPFKQHFNGSISNAGP